MQMETNLPVICKQIQQIVLQHHAKCSHIETIFFRVLHDGMLPLVPRCDACDDVGRRISVAGARRVEK